MHDSLERVSFRNPEPRGQLQEETLRLHKERYAYAGRFVEGQCVLDLACGVGYGSVILKNAGAASVVGVDISASAIEEAKELYAREGVHFFCEDYRDIRNTEKAAPELAQAFEQQFDVVVCLETIEHLPDPTNFIQTMMGGLRSDGLLIGSVPVTPSVDANPYHLHDFSPRTFRNLLRREGLTIREHHRQRQPFNPISVRREMATDLREGLRKNLSVFYLSHPSKFFLRIGSTLRHGFVNLIDTVVAEKSQDVNPTHSPSTPRFTRV